MKILHCNTTDTGGGAARAAYRLFSEQNKNGINAKMLVMGKKKHHPAVLSVMDYLRKDDLFTKLIRKIHRKILAHYRTLKLRRYPFKGKMLLSDITFSYLGNSLSKIEFDLLHLHWVEGGFINFKDLRNLNKPIVWKMCGSFPLTGLCHYLLCEKYKVQCGKCPALGSEKKKDFSTEVFLKKKKRYKALDLHIVSPGKWMAQRVKDSALLGDRPVYIIPNGIDSNLFSAVPLQIAREALGLNKDSKIILFGAKSATTDENKGFKFLRKALDLLYNTNSHIELLVFGATKEESNLNLKFPVTYLGDITNDKLLILAYSSADVLVIPSIFENFSNVILESLSCKTPVVGFNIGGNPDMIDHKENGYLAKSYKEHDLANGIKWCLDNNQNNILGENARSKILNNFTIEATSKQHVELYRSILQKS